MSYNLEWRPVGGATTTVTGITDLFYDLTGLTAGTDYEFRVQEDDGTTLSGWSAWTGFTTESVSEILVLPTTGTSTVGSQDVVVSSGSSSTTDQKNSVVSSQ